MLTGVFIHFPTTDNPGGRGHEQLVKVFLDPNEAVAYRDYLNDTHNCFDADGNVGPSWFLVDPVHLSSK